MRSLRLAALLLLLALPAFAARVTITSYGIPHSYGLKASDVVSIDASGLFFTVTSSDTGSKTRSTKYFLGYSNRVTFDTVGGALANLLVNTSDSGAISHSMGSIDSITFVPQVDTSGDDDGDGLSNFEELMIYHTDPKKKDSDGDGISDYVEAHYSQKVFNPLVANLPSITVSMRKSPAIYLISSKSGETSRESSLSTSESWGEDDASTSSRSVTNSEQIAVGNTTTFSTVVDGGFLALGCEFGTSVAFSINVTQGHEVSNQWSYERRKSYNKAYESASSSSSSSGWTVSGGKITVPVKVANIGDIGFTLSNPTFTLYGTTYVKGNAVDEALFSFNSPGSTDLNAKNDSFVVVLEKNDLTLAEVQKFGTFDQLHVALTGLSTAYKIDGNDLSYSNVSTTVGASTARVEVDFDNPMNGQESPMVRYVAALTKWIPETYSYAPVYLGEMLSQMGLTYTYDSLGFVAINGQSRTPTRRWWTGIVRSYAGGMKKDTMDVNFGSFGGPDRVVVDAGDVVMVAYTGDDDHDGLPNSLERLLGTSDSLSADYDHDGIPDSLEYYGWKKAKVVPGYAGHDTATYRSNPASWDSDGDGIKDILDSLPLIPAPSAHTKLLKVRLLDNWGKVVDSVALGASLRGTVKELGSVARFQLVVDSMPSRINATLNSGRASFGFGRLLSDTSEIAFQSGCISGDSVFRIGADSIAITLTPMDGSKATTWTILGTSSIASSASLSNGLQRSSSYPWRVVNLSLSIASQVLTDSRTQGILVLRGAVDSVVQAPRLDPQSEMPSGSVTDGVGKWRILDTLPVNSGATVTFQDTKVPQGGVAYRYALIPFAKQDGYYRFAQSGTLTEAIKTKRLQARPMLDYVTYVGGGTDGGNDKADMCWRMSYSGHALDTVVHVDKFGWNWVESRTQLAFPDTNAFKWVDIGYGGKLSTVFQVWEDDDGDSTSYSRGYSHEGTNDDSVLLSDDWFSADSGYGYEKLDAVMGTALTEHGDTRTQIDRKDLANQTVSDITFNYATKLELRVVE